MTRIHAFGPDFSTAVSRFTDELGFRLEVITPADNPRLAVVSRGDLLVEIQRDAEPTRPEPTRIDPHVPVLEISQSGDDEWVAGRAGMRYRDLVPSRHGGRIIASNIEVCDGGPVLDMVHHHAIQFQLIFCEHGWVDVVYEDQGPPFRMHAGDGVLQPPHIRHRVLESSAGARVVEIGCPAEHDTLFDHDLELPTTTLRPDRDFGGQRFVRHQGAIAPWAPVVGARSRDFEEQVTAISTATGGLVDVRFVRSAGSGNPGEANGDPGGSRFVAPEHLGSFDFGFVYAGQASLQVEDGSHLLGPGMSFSLPAPVAWKLVDATADFRLLCVRA